MKSKLFVFIAWLTACQWPGLTPRDGFSVRNGTIMGWPMSKSAFFFSSSFFFFASSSFFFLSAASLAACCSAGSSEQPPQPDIGRATSITTSSQIASASSSVG